MSLFRRHVVFVTVAMAVCSFRAPLAAGSSGVRWIDPEGINGHLVIVGGGEIPAEVREAFLERAGGKEARLVVIPTASAEADERDESANAAGWTDAEVESVTVLHTHDRGVADTEEFVKPLRDATAVWFQGGMQSRIAAAYLGTKVERELHKLLKRGGVIGGTSAGAAIMSRVMIASGNPKPEIATGFDFLPGAIVDQHFDQRNRQPRLRAAVSEHPELFGIGLDEGTAIIVDGRGIEISGTGNATIVFAGTESEAGREETFGSGELLDLTSLRRRAQERVASRFPPERAAVPRVDSGALVLVGGGMLPGEIVRRFIELAGGEQARIVILPTAVPPPPKLDLARETRFLRQFGARDVKVLTARRREEVESKTFESVIGDATGLWFGGGRQWRFIDAYAGTKAEKWFQGVLERGGVIGGSSAGASIQAEYLARGNPLGNADIMAPGYERGLGFLPGTAVDQHFTQRNRFGDMSSLVNRYPQLLGIGIDEGTALVIMRTRGNVIGRGRVHFYDRNRVHKDAHPDYESLWAGLSYDLEHRRAIPLVAPRPPAIE